MDTPLISVIIPAYNAEKTLEAAVRSVLSQTWGNIEVIVVDDCSADATGEIAGAIAAGDSRVRVYRNESNHGVSYNRNFGVKAAAGSYVAFLDSDDLWLPEKLEKQMRLVERYPEASLFFTGSGFITEDGKRYGYVLRVPENINYRQLAAQNLISCSSVLARRETMLAFPMENDEVHEDFAVWLRILRQESYAYGVDEPLLVYRVSGNSKSGNKVKAAKMTFNTYRFVGIPPLQRIWSFFLYTLRSVRKYSALRASVTEEDYFS